MSGYEVQANVVERPAPLVDVHAKPDPDSYAEQRETAWRCRRTSALERAIAGKVRAMEEDGFRAVMEAIHAATQVTLVERKKW